MEPNRGFSVFPGGPMYGNYMLPGFYQPVPTQRQDAHGMAPQGTANPWGMHHWHQQSGPQAAENPQALQQGAQYITERSAAMENSEISCHKYMSYEQKIDKPQSEQKPQPDLLVQEAKACTELSQQAADKKRKETDSVAGVVKRKKKICESDGQRLGPVHIGENIVFNQERYLYGLRYSKAGSDKNSGKNDEKYQCNFCLCCLPCNKFHMHLLHHTFTCAYCSFRTFTRVELDLHYRNVHGVDGEQGVTGFNQYQLMNMVEVGVMPELRDELEITSVYHDKALTQTGVLWQPMSIPSYVSLRVAKNNCQLLSDVPVSMRNAKDNSCGWAEQGLTVVAALTFHRRIDAVDATSRNGESIQPGQPLRMQKEYHCNFCQFTDCRASGILSHIRSHTFTCNAAECKFFALTHHELVLHKRHEHGLPCTLSSGEKLEALIVGNEEMPAGLAELSQEWGEPKLITLDGACIADWNHGAWKCPCCPITCCSKAGMATHMKYCHPGLDLVPEPALASLEKPNLLHLCAAGSEGGELTAVPLSAEDGDSLAVDDKELELLSLVSNQASSSVTMATQIGTLGGGSDCSKVTQPEPGSSSERGVKIEPDEGDLELCDYQMAPQDMELEAVMKHLEQQGSTAVRVPQGSSKSETSKRICPQNMASQQAAAVSASVKLEPAATMTKAATVQPGVSRRGGTAQSGQSLPKLASKPVKNCVNSLEFAFIAADTAMAKVKPCGTKFEPTTAERSMAHNRRSYVAAVLMKRCTCCNAGRKREEYVCNFCPFFSYTFKELAVHLPHHEFSCCTCSFQTFSRLELLLHHRSCHPDLQGPNGELPATLLNPENARRSLRASRFESFVDWCVVPTELGNKDILLSTDVYQPGAHKTNHKYPKQVSQNLIYHSDYRTAIALSKTSGKGNKIVEHSCNFCKAVCRPDLLTSHGQNHMFECKYSDCAKFFFTQFERLVHVVQMHDGFQHPGTTHRVRLQEVNIVMHTATAQRFQLCPTPQ